MKIYLASPFFTTEQLAVVEQIESTLRGLGHEVFSPREGTKLGETLGKTMEERKASAKEIYKRNVDAMTWADITVAVVDGSDAGTLWEMGWCSAKRTPIVSFTSKLKGLNIMLQECVVAHCVGIDQLDSLFSWEEPLLHVSEYQNFHPDMV